MILLSSFIEETLDDLVGVRAEIRWRLMEDKQLKFNQPLLSVRRISPGMISERDEKKKTVNSFSSMTRPPHYKSELKSGLVGKPGTVPFLWEHSPGRPKEESSPQTRLVENRPAAPKLPPGRKLRDNQDSDKALELDENVKKVESFDSSKETRHNKDMIESEDDDDEAYLDALDTLSRAESSFLNCSVSGLSGFDEPNAKQSGTFLMNPQTKDFMMDRFLPAAKAMTSETPYYVRKKQPPAQDQPKQPKNVINGDSQPQLRYGPSFTLYHSRAHDYKEDEEESDDDCYDNGNLPTKICGLLPHFCFKRSFRLLNPVPAMSVRTRVPTPPASRTQTGSSSTASYSGTENEQSTSDVSEQKYIVGSITTQPHEDKNDIEGRAYSTYANDPYDNKTIIGLLSDQINIREVDIVAPLAEKTLYVDIVHKMDSAVKISRSLDTKPSKLQHKDVEMLEQMIKQKPFVDSFETSLKPYLQRKADFSSLRSAEKLNNGKEMKARIATGHAQDCYQDAIGKPDSDDREETRRPIQRREKLENSCKVHPEFLVPPPLPKSPSDSWLCRTLPSLSTKNASSRAYIGAGQNPNDHSSKPQSSDSKWETIVKMTKKQEHM